MKLFIALLLLPLPLLAAGEYSLLAPFGGMTTVTMGQYLATTIKVLIGIAGILAVVMIVICGITLMTSESASGKEEAKKCIGSALLGIILALGSWLLLNTINPDLLGTTFETPSTENAVTPPPPASGATIPPENTLLLDKTTYTVNEEDGTVTITVRRPDAYKDTDASFRYMTVSGLAQSGVDFEPKNAVITFGKGETEKTITVPIKDNELYGGGAIPSFRIQFLSPSGINLGKNPSVVVQIKDGETKYPEVANTSSSGNTPQPGVVGLIPYFTNNASGQQAALNYVQTQMTGQQLWDVMKTITDPAKQYAFFTAVVGSGSGQNDLVQVVLSNKFPGCTTASACPAYSNWIQQYETQPPVKYNFNIVTGRFTTTIGAGTSSTLSGWASGASVGGNNSCSASIPFSGTCPGYASTHWLKLNWGGSTGNITAYTGTWGPNEAVVASFTTPNQTAVDKSGGIVIAEFVGMPAYKMGVLSTTPCDFTGPGLAMIEGVTANVFYSVGPNTHGWTVLQPNTTYYYNVLNRQNGADSCGAQGATDCAAKVELSKPGGLGALPAGKPVTTCTGNTNPSDGSCTISPAKIPNTCYGRNVSAINWDWSSKGDYFVHQAPRRLSYASNLNTMEIISFTTQNDTYKGGIDSAWHETSSAFFISDTPCDVNFSLSHGLITRGLTSGNLSFLVATPNNETKIRNDATLSSSGELFWILKGNSVLRPNTTYYIHRLNASFTFPAPAISNATLTSTPEHCANSPACPDVTFDFTHYLWDMNTWNASQEGYQSGSAIQGYTQNTSAPPTPAPICSASRSGVCGSANGTTVATKPTANRCSVGTATTVTGTGPWNWTCRGTGGGATVNCTTNSSNSSSGSSCPWTQIAPTIFPTDPRGIFSGSGGDVITSLAVNPINSNEVLLTIQRNATAVFPIAFSPTYTANIALMELYKSVDNGSTWVKLNTPNYYNGTGHYPIASLIRYAPSNQNTLYMDGAHYRSTDGGNTWTDIQLPSALQINSGALAIHPNIPTTLIASIGTQAGAAAARSIDGGTTWSAIGTGFPNGWTSEAVSYDQNNPNSVYLAGWVYPNQFTRFYRSDDGGNAWVRKGDLGTGIPGQIEVGPDGTLYVKGNFGLMVSTDGGTSWTKKSPSGVGHLSNGFQPGMTLSSGVLYTASYDVHKTTGNWTTWTKINNNLPIISPASGQTDATVIGQSGKYLLVGTLWHGLWRQDTTCNISSGGNSGSCGSVDETTVSTKPSLNLCTTGTASTVTGTGPWNWTCGGTANCTAYKTSSTGSGTNPTTPRYCAVFATSPELNCMTAPNFTEIKNYCCPSGTITACTATSNGVEITGTNCN